MNFGDDPRVIEKGEWAPLSCSQLHCEGWGPHGRRGATSENCDGGTGVWVTRRARWMRWDGVLQCGTCKRHDVARVSVAA